TWREEETILFVYLTEFNSTTGEISRQGYSGGNITVTCSHIWASTNKKYFCRDPCENRDIFVKSDQTPKGRYTLKDYRDGNFAVSIIDLRESDSGIYWCGVERTGPDSFWKVKLIVSKGKNDEQHHSNILIAILHVRQSNEGLQYYHSNDESQSNPIYQNLQFNTTQGEDAYGNL
uniref:Immunoglobulin V-set domain-containing protein n=1 Tax=Cyprinus carpio TaxID=7962 RepID=A0A8C1YZG3_CYPCA